MANPFSIGSLTTLPRGAGAGTDNITGKASSGSKIALGLGKVDWSSAVPYDGMVQMKVKTNATTPTGNKILSLYLITSLDGTIFTDGIDPDSASDQSSKINQALCVGVFTNIAASTTYYFDTIDIPAILGYIPLYWAIVWQLDVTAGGFSSTAGDHSTKSLQESYA